MGVKKLKFAPNKTHKINGFIDKSKPEATAIAIGVIITAVALLLIKLLNNIEIKKILPMENICE